MGLLTVEFFALVAVSLILFRAARAPVWRRTVLAAASLVFALSYMGGKQGLLSAAGLASILPLAVLALAGYAAVRLTGRASPALLAAAVIGVYAFMRYSLPDLTADADWVVVVGSSYILFRVLHILFDKAQGELPAVPGLPGYLLYLFFFPTFLAGPIWRLEEYRASLDEAVSGPAPDGPQVFAAFSRIANGGIKILVLVDVFAAFHHIFRGNFTVAEPGGAMAAVCCSFAAIAYLVYFYFDFSGYMDIVIGVGALFGLKLPENFDAPFSCDDLIDFWNRWHITLSQWIQHYLFTPLVAFLSRRLLGRVKIETIGVVGFLVSFFVIGVWHGPTMRFVYFGLLLGVFASATKMWDSWLKRRLGAKRAGTVKNHRVYKDGAGSLGVFLVAVALSALWFRPESLAGIGVVFAACLLASGMLGAFFCRTLSGYIRRLTLWLEHPGPLRQGGSGGSLLASLGAEVWLAVRCLVIVGILSVQGTDMPAFLYQGF